MTEETKPKFYKKISQNIDLNVLNNNTNQILNGEEIKNEEEENKNKLEFDEEEEGTEDLIEDMLDLPGTIEKAKIHGNAKKVLKNPKRFPSNKLVVFCNDCFLPQETEGVVEKYSFSVDPKNLSTCGVGLYLFFIFQKYLIVNLICLFITCSLPYIIICNNYANHLFKYCTEFYVKDTTPINFETNNEYCVNFINSDEYDYTAFDWMNKWSGETMLFYIKILKDFATQNQIDKVVFDFNFISFISLIVLFIINLIYVSYTTALKNEIDFNEQSPSDYTLIVSDIPKEECDEYHLKNYYLDQELIDIKEINLTYNLTEILELKTKVREMKKKLKEIGNNEFYEDGFLCCKKKKKTIDLQKEKKEIHMKLKGLEIDYSKDVFNGVAFIVFDKEEEALNYSSLYPDTFLMKFLINTHRRFLLCCCSCCLDENRKKSLKVKTQLTVGMAPEPEDVIFEHLEYNFKYRFIRTLVLFIISILLCGISFAIVIVLNEVQYKSEKNLENNIILKYGLSTAITAVTSLINFLMKTLFTKFGDYEKPWTYTYKYLSMSMKLTIFSFVNSAIVPFVSNGIEYGWDTHENLVNNMFMTFVCGAIVAPLMSITCYDLILNKIFRWFFVTRKYKDEKEELPLTQRELNSYYENPDMGVSSQYSNLSKQVLMTFFYMPIFPLGPAITLIGVILNYVIEKFKCVYIYKRPEKLNEKIAFFYIDYFVMAFFAWAVGNYIFLSKQHSSHFFELFNLIFYGVLLIVPYNTFLRNWDISNAYSYSNEISYDNAYLTFAFDYERLNPKTQKRGAYNYIDKLVKFGYLTEEMGKIAKDKIALINLKMLFYFTSQTNNFQRENIVNKDEKSKKNENENKENENNINATEGNVTVEKDEENDNKDIEEIKFEQANNFLNNLGIIANTNNKNDKKSILNNNMLFNKSNIKNINPIFGAVYSQMAQEKYDKIFKLRRQNNNNQIGINRVQSEYIDGENKDLDDSSSI